MNLLVVILIFKEKNPYEKEETIVNVEKEKEDEHEEMTTERVRIEIKYLFTALMDKKAKIFYK